MRTQLERLAIISSLVTTIACGGSGNPTQPSSNPTPPSAAGAPTPPPSSTSTLPQAQVNNIRAAVDPALALALSKIGSALTTLGVKDGVRQMPYRITPESTRSVSGSTSCPDSGTATISGTVTDNTTVNGAGSAGLNLQIGFSNCRSAGILIQGNPSLLLAAQYNFSNFRLVNPLTFTLGGGITFVLDNVTGSASFNCAGNVNVSSFLPSLGGSITLQYPVGRNATTVSCDAF